MYENPIFPRIFLQIGSQSDYGDTVTFNWTRFLQNYHQLQQHLTDMFTTDIQLTKFFNYKGDLNMWLDRLEKMLETRSSLSSGDDISQM